MNHAKHDLLMFAVVSLLVFEPLFITQKHVLKQTLIVLLLVE